MSEKLVVRFKKLHKDAVIPKYARVGDGGMDLTAVSYEYDEKTLTHVYGFGLAVEIPEGYVGLIFPRSSIYKTPLLLSNSVGVIDQYRGELKACFKDGAGYLDRMYKVGDRIAQLMIIPFPEIDPVEVDELSETERGTGGFGSTGN